MNGSLLLAFSILNIIIDINGFFSQSHKCQKDVSSHKNSNFTPRKIKWWTFILSPSIILASGKLESRLDIEYHFNVQDLGGNGLWTGEYYHIPGCLCSPGKGFVFYTGKFSIWYTKYKPLVIRSLITINVLWFVRKLNSRLSVFFSLQNQVYYIFMHIMMAFTVMKNLILHVVIWPFSLSLRHLNACMGCSSYNRESVRFIARSEDITKPINTHTKLQGNNVVN